MSHARDPRAFITPESFTVAPDLLGLPLATPGRRLLAILFDLLPLAVLANAGPGIFLAFALAFFVWRMLSARRVRVPRGLRTIVRLAASMAALVIVIQTASAWQRGRERDREERESAAEAAETAGRRPAGLMSVVSFTADTVGIGFGWGALYFTTFLVLGRGQTPGKRLMRIRVIRLDGKPIGWWLAFERFGSYFASISTGLLGFAQIFWDRNRQALHDKAVETVVIRVTPAPPPAFAAPSRPPGGR